MANEKKISANVVLKSGLWYTISNFAFRTVAFITTPFFARILSPAQYGEFNNIASWVAILSVFTSCDLHMSIIRAKLDYEDDIERYGFTVLTLGSVITAALFALTMIFKGPLAELMGIQPKYFVVIYLYLFFLQGFYVYITIERAHYRYKTFSVLTGVGIVSSCLISLLLVAVMRDKLDARVFGQYCPYIVLGFILYIFVGMKGKSVYFPYYRYSLCLSLPLVPHLLSMTVLSSSDRIMITRMAGSKYTAIYSVAYIIANIIVVLIDSMNKAWAPWFLDTLKAGGRQDVKKAALPYFGVFIAGIIGILLVAPEVIMILGGKKYIGGIYVLPPLIAGCAFQFAYTMYVQVEFFEKKMKTVAVATSIAALTNILLNFIFIPIFGYIAAGYTTLAGYAVLFAIHYSTIVRLGYRDIFDRKVIFGGLLTALAALPAALILYRNPAARYAAAVLYAALLAAIVYRKRKALMSLAAKRRGRRGKA